VIATLSAPLTRWLAGALVVAALVAAVLWFRSEAHDARADLAIARKSVADAVGANATLLADNARREREATEAAQREAQREAQTQALIQTNADLARRWADVKVTPDCMPRPGERIDLDGVLQRRPAAIGGR
jgi:hypothetical protein